MPLSKVMIFPKHSATSSARTFFLRLPSRSVSFPDDLDHNQVLVSDDKDSEYTFEVWDSQYRSNKQLFSVGPLTGAALLVAIGVGADGYREILGVCEGTKEDKESWRNFLRHLKERGLKGVRLVVSDKCLGLVEALGEFFPEAQWQRCVVHWYRNVFTATPKSKVKAVAAMLKAIHAQEDREAARRKAVDVAEKLEAMKLA